MEKVFFPLSFDEFYFLHSPIVWIEEIEHGLARGPADVSLDCHYYGNSVLPVIQWRDELATTRVHEF